MNLTHREQQEIIALTTTRLAPLRRYAETARPTNHNQNWSNRDWNNHDWDTDNSEACLRLADKVRHS